MSTRKLEVVITGDSRNLQRAVGGVSKDMGRLESTTRKVGKGIAIGLGVGLAAAIPLMFKAGEAASDLDEQINKSKAVFKGSAGEVRKWSEDTASSLGISQRAALEATGTFGNMLVPMGIARGKAADMSVSMVNLAADMASFNNASPEEVLEALRSGLAGESEPLRKFGVFLSDARLKQEALSMGLYKGKGALDANAKAQATYALILKDTKDAQGDFARTSDGVANSQRIARAELENTAATTGRLLTPVMKNVLVVVNDVLRAFQRNWPQIRATTETVFRAIGRVVSQVMDYIDANVLPTIRAIVSGARAFWSRFGGDITKAFNLVRSVVQTNMKGVLAIITGILAVLRGDWGTAWNSLKTVVSSAVKGVYAILRGVPSVILGIAANIGRAIIQGIVSGIQSSAGAIGSALRGAVQSAVSSVGSVSGLDLAKKAIGLDELGDPAKRGLRTAAPGSSLDLERTSGAGDRGARQARMAAETKARGSGKDADAIRREGDRAYANARLGTINQLRGKIKTRRANLLKSLGNARKALAGVKVPSVRGKGKAAEKSAKARQAALDRRAKIQENISAIQDELETLYTDDVGYVVEAGELGEELKEIDRSDEAAQQEAAASAAAAAQQAVSDALDAQVALAALTEGNADDIAAAQAVEAQAAAELAAAQASGDNARIAPAARALQSARQNLEQLQATKENTAAVEANTEQIKQSFGGSTTFGYRGQDFVLRSLAPPSSDRDALVGGLV